jgi:hypothetical protein
MEIEMSSKTLRKYGEDISWKSKRMNIYTTVSTTPSTLILPPNRFAPKAPNGKLQEMVISSGEGKPIIINPWNSERKKIMARHN